jgi:glycosyltransferase involved in cell wall biosynthesis
VTTVFLYNPSWHMMGGGEKFIAAIGEFIARDPANSVTLLADREDTSLEQLHRVFDLDCSKLNLVHIKPGTARTALGHADLAVLVSNFRSFRSHAGKTVLILQIPYSAINPATIARRFLSGALKEGLKDISRLSLMNDARTADLVLVYSAFVRDTLRRNHGVNAEVLYPPIDDFGPGRDKKNVILSVGRIFRGSYNDKRYDALIEGFRLLCDSSGTRDWEYHIVGNSGSDAASQSYLGELRRQAEGYPIRFFVNEPYTRLREHYAEAAIFWHGAGFGINEQKDPERTEHFGMTTVEAMSTGSIPVVVNNGGQKEIVRHDECGFVWNTLDELAQSTLRIIRDGTVRSRLEAGARRRFFDFDRLHFEARLRELLAHL